MGKFDGILDDVIVNAKAAASVVSKKASDVYDNSKQKIVAAEIRAEINTKLKELGALTYKSVVHGTDLSDKIKEKSAEITELKENLDLINDSIISRIEGSSLNAEVMFLKIQSSATAAAQSLMKIKHSFNI